jgi:hypothetical protein
LSGIQQVCKIEWMRWPTLKTIYFQIVIIFCSQFLWDCAIHRILQLVYLLYGILFTNARGMDFQMKMTQPGSFFLTAKYGGIDSGWCIYWGNYPHLLRNVFWLQRKNPGHSDLLVTTSQHRFCTRLLNKITKTLRHRCKVQVHYSTSECRNRVLRLTHVVSRHLLIPHQICLSARWVSTAR